MKKIDLMIVGAQKAGTSSLLNYMYEHPAILGHHQLELNFFSDDSEYDKGYEATFKKYFTTNTSPNASSTIAKNATLYTNEAALRRLYEHNPNCQIVFIVRNPTARAYSSYSMEHERGWMTRPFNEVLSIIEKDDKQDLMYRIFIKLGLYSDYMKLLQSIFPAQNIHLILFEELQKKPAEVCRRMFQLLGIDDTFTPDVSKIHNETVQTKSAFYSRFLHWLRQEKNPLKRMAKAILPHRWFSSLGTKMVEANKSTRRVEPLDDATRAALNAFFEPYNAELERIAGVDLSGWRK